MSRYARDKRDSFRPRPVTRINVDIKNHKLQIAFVAFFLAVAAVAFGYFGIKALSQEPGWKEVTVQSADGNSVASEFSLYYNLGQSGISATAEYKALTIEYEQMAADAYKVFNAHEAFAGVGNLASLNQNPNTPVTLDPALYAALEKLDAFADRRIYLAPVYEGYHDLFFCEYDFQAQEYDPFRNPELAEFYRQVCAFANEPLHIHIELLGDNVARLNVSDAYKAFAKENGIETYLDLYWMRNAFVADYLAQKLTEKGYVFATLSSNDGFCRVLDPTETQFSTDILDWAGNGAFKAASVQLTGPVATVSLHTYDLFGAPEKRYFRTADNSLLHPCIDPADGLCKAALNDLVLYSKTQGCADLLLNVLPVYCKDEFVESDLLALCTADSNVVYCRDNTILHSEKTAQFINLFVSSTLSYTTKAVG